MELVTGYAGEPHVTAKQTSVMNAVGLGMTGKYVIMNIENEMSLQFITATKVRINSGYAVNQGRLISNEDYEDLIISPAISGEYREDLIVIRYEKDNQTGVESARLMVIEGESGDSYLEPSYYDNNIIEDGSSIDDLVLYKIFITPDNLSSEQVFKRWYLDTGWRTDLISYSFSTISTADFVEPAIRCVGNRVYLKGRLTSTEVNRTYTLAGRVKPVENVYWSEIARGPSQATPPTPLTYFNSYKLETSGQLTVTPNELDSSLPIYTSDSFNLSWFID